MIDLLERMDIEPVGGNVDLGKLFEALSEHAELGRWVIQGMGEQDIEYSGPDAARLVERYLGHGGGWGSDESDARAIALMVADYNWVVRQDGRMVVDERRTAALVELLRHEFVVEVIRAVRAVVACPTCGAARGFGVGFGRVFIDECTPCSRVSALARLSDWRDTLVEGWRSGPAVAIRDVHWRRSGVTFDSRMSHLLGDEDDERCGVYMFGDSGTGKTQQSVELVREVFRRRAARYSIGDAERFGWGTTPQSSVMYASESALLESLRPGGGRQRSEYEEVDLLIIDDLGTASATAWASEQMGALIDARCGNMKSTLVTSNYSLKQLLESPSNAYDQRVVRRLYDMCGGSQARDRGRLALWRMDTNYSLPEGW